MCFCDTVFSWPEHIILSNCVSLVFLWCYLLLLIIKFNFCSSSIQNHMLVIPLVFQSTPRPKKWMPNDGMMKLDGQHFLLLCSVNQTSGWFLFFTNFYSFYHIWFPTNFFWLTVYLEQTGSSMFTWFMIFLERIWWRLFEICNNWISVFWAQLWVFATFYAFQKEKGFPFWRSWTSVLLIFQKLKLVFYIFWDFERFEKLSLKIFKKVEILICKNFSIEHFFF